ncbi:MAG: DrmB family protein [Ktedonobacteraceae bacterium]
MIKKYAVGDVRPSQLLLTYGVGAIIDLPHLSTLIMGLDDWDTSNMQEINEERLLQALQSTLGPQLKRLLSPPHSPDTPQGPFDPAALIGVPVATFPRWMVCPRCHLLAPVESGYFELKPHPFQSDRIRYVHHNCSKQPQALPSRFMIACENGHLDDFPYAHFVHGDKPCKASLRWVEMGVSGEPSDIYIKCETCGVSRPMSDAFSSAEEQRYHPTCHGRRPHLRDYQQPCEYKDKARTILLAASNTWFPLIYNTLSIPAGVDTLEQLVEEHWTVLQGADSVQDVAAFRRIRLLERLGEYADEDIWTRVEAKKTTGSASARIRPSDLKIPEWEVLSNAASAPRATDFEATPVSVPDGYSDVLSQVVLVERLREVMAMTGFTRIESLRDYAEEEELPGEHIMPLSRNALRWVPAAEVRGEGIFLQFREDALERWLTRPAVARLHSALYEGHVRWRKARHIPRPEVNYPGIRYVLLHTFAHALMRQLTLECGYTAASIRERIYALSPDSEYGPMAGILLYTAAPDSEGTLGGLVSLGRPDQLGWHIDGALEAMEHCASDPLCAEHNSKNDHTLHEAACHACMFIPETSCERGNKYLDRSVLVRTVERDDLAFFPRK